MAGKGGGKGEKGQCFSCFQKLRVLRRRGAVGRRGRRETGVSLSRWGNGGDARAGCPCSQESGGDFDVPDWERGIEGGKCIDGRIRIARRARPAWAAGKTGVRQFSIHSGGEPALSIRPAGGTPRPQLWGRTSRFCPRPRAAAMGKELVEMGRQRGLRGGGNVVWCVVAGATRFRRACRSRGCAPRSPVGLVNPPGKNTKANDELALAA